MSEALDLIDPELRPLLDMWPTLTLDAAMLADIRTGGRTLPIPPIVANQVLRTQHRVPGPPGAPEIVLTVYTPQGAGPFPCIYHIHGGGYVMGDAASLEFRHRPLAEDLGAVIVSVDYRLAPETAHPGPVEDCYAGLAWVVANAATLNVDVARLGVTGESAGGGLAAALALLARDRGDFALAFQLLVYPMIDDRTVNAEPHPHVGRYIWTPASNHFGWSALLGHAPGVEGVSPYAAAARADDLAGLPPTFITTGALDLFLEEDLDYARRLIRAGVPTELHVYPGAFHGFDIHPTAAVAVRARTDHAAALKRFLR
ncbi:arylesterase [Sphingomonas sp. Leaf357]|uniref:alpha/beta hydrolase n=1 Tax=Sphingomonas sp. Leaf357 TaxID=1736350 RepID=UPI0006F43B45|nr:alpha/beta hydrolase [Sphingomonas sp. Leaf357]KQS03745.1 arylesterase [Sphingomonas sp. Leaf357]